MAEATTAPTIEQISVDEFKRRMRAQGAKRIEDVRFTCPMCKCEQTAQDLIDAGVGKTIDDVEGLVAFSCVGRFTGAEPPRAKPDGNPCDWTLGGLFGLHQLEVIDEHGKAHPRFQVSSA